jgi:cyanophycinase
MAESQDTQQVSDPVSSSDVRKVVQGPVMPIGGAEDKDSHGGSTEDILKRFVQLAGGKQAKILLIPTASEVPDEMVKDYEGAFGKLGVGSIDALMIEDREDANSQEAIDQIAGATGIFITGGSQARLVSFLTGTLAMEAIRRRNAEDVIVGGTSAGASILASHMMLGGTGLAGDSGDNAARKHMVELAAGFGLLQDIIIDQHFSERGRMGRLLSIYAANPGLLSIGLDEDTAVVIERNGNMEVLGSGMVTVIDGRNAVSDYFERKVGEVLTVADSHLSVLGPGRRFDLNERRAIMDEETEQ